MALVCSWLICLVREAGGLVGDRGDRGDAEAEEAGEDDFRNGGHAHGVGAEGADGADLGRGFEGGAGIPGVDAFGQWDALGLCRRPERRAEGGVVGVGHGDEAGVGGFPDERVETGEVDVVRQEHQVAGVDVGMHGACGVGEDQGLGAEGLEDLERQAHGVAPAAFVVMRAAAEDGDASALQIADDEFRVVARDARVRETGQVGVVDGDTVDLLGEVAEAGAEDEAEARRDVPGAVADQGGEILSVP
jgi:hypothetical protein